MNRLLLLVLPLPVERVKMRFNVPQVTLNLKFCLKLFVFIIIFLARKSLSGDIVIPTKFGLVKGHESKIGKSMHTFRNIPYAKQPIGDMRFQLPEDVDPWNSEDDLEQQKDIYCPQNPLSYTSRSTNDAFGQEDCLVLDLYKPFEGNILPVLIYFHAGRFSYGSKQDYVRKFLLEFKEIIIVIPNYRLGILGFLRNENHFLPENLGLLDQRMAMKWVYENIQFFGGDPQAITIAGHEAGGSSVGFHILSPHSHRYFNNAISSSGTALDPWILAHSPSASFGTVSRGLNCSDNTSDEIIKCLRRSSFRDILKVQASFKNNPFLPTVDVAAIYPFLPLTPTTLYKRGYQKNVSYLAGTMDGAAFEEVSSEFPTAIKTQHLDKIIEHLLNPYFQDVVNFPLIVKAAKYHYLRGIHIPTFDSIQPQMVDMVSDFLYNSPLQTTLKWHSKTSPNTYMYVWSDTEEDLRSIFGLGYKKEQSGTTHLKDSILKLNTTLMKETVSYNEKGNPVKENILKVWSSFIKTGSPSFPQWEKFNMKDMNYVEISQSVKAKTNYRKQDIELWTLLMPDLEKIEDTSSTENLKQITYEMIDTSSWGVAGLCILFGVLCIALVGVVVIARRKFTRSSIIPTSYQKNDVKRNI